MARVQYLLIMSAVGVFTLYGVWAETNIETANLICVAVGMVFFWGAFTFVTCVYVANRILIARRRD